MQPPAYQVNGQPIGFAQNPQPQVIHIQPTPSTVIVAVAPPGPTPFRLQCPHCRADVTTRVHHESGTMTHILAIV